MSYNGKGSDGCEYASVRKEKGGKILLIHNFKKCLGKKIAYIGKTEERDKKRTTDEAIETINYTRDSRFKANCERNNQATANMYGFTVRCIKLHNNSHKFVLLEDGKLLGAFIRE